MENRSTSILVVGHEQDARAHRFAVDDEPLDPTPVLQRYEERAQPCQGLSAVAALLSAVDEPRIDAQRDVVEEQPLADAPHVDPPLDAVLERRECGNRIIGVEPDVAGEVVSSAPRNAHERQVALDRGLCHRRRATRRPQPSRAPRRRSPARALRDRHAPRGRARRYRARWRQTSAPRRSGRPSPSWD